MSIFVKDISIIFLIYISGFDSDLIKASQNELRSVTFNGRDDELL